MTEAKFHAVGDMIKHTPTAARAIGEVFLFNGEAVYALDAIAANADGTVQRKGLARIQKVTGAIATGAEVYWDEDGDPLGGTAGTGALTASATAGNFFVGVVRDAAASADTFAIVDINASAGGLQASDILVNVAASAAITNTTTETDFDKSFTIDEGEIAVGSVFRVRIQCIATATNSTDTLEIKLYAGTEEIVTTGALDVADNDIAYIDAIIVIRTIGASGTLVGTGVVSIGVEGTATAKPFKKASAVEDMTAGLEIKATGEWSVANAGNSVRLDIIAVEKLR